MQLLDRCPSQEATQTSCSNKAEMQPGEKQAYVVLNKMNREGPTQPKHFKGAMGCERRDQGVYRGGRRQEEDPMRIQSALLICTQCSNYENTSWGKARIFV